MHSENLPTRSSVGTKALCTKTSRGLGGRCQWRSAGPLWLSGATPGPSELLFSNYLLGRNISFVTVSRYANTGACFFVFVPYLTAFQIFECLVFWGNHDSLSSMARNDARLDWCASWFLIGHWAWRNICLPYHVTQNESHSNWNVQCHLPVHLLIIKLCLFVQ